MTQFPSGVSILGNGPGWTGSMTSRQTLANPSIRQIARNRLAIVKLIKNRSGFDIRVLLVDLPQNSHVRRMDTSGIPVRIRPMEYERALGLSIPQGVP